MGINKLFQKYKLIFNFLKKKVGPDASRIITYSIYCNDNKLITSEQINKLFELENFLGKVFRNSRLRLLSLDPYGNNNGYKFRAAYTYIEYSFTYPYVNKLEPGDINVIIIMSDNMKRQLRY
jgi:hypothetical protein